MFCYKCGNQISEKIRFCPKCGTEISRIILEDSQPVDKKKEAGQTYFLKEYGITVSKYSASDSHGREGRKIPVNQDVLDDVSIITSRIPEIMANKKAQQILKRPVYAITFNGRDVMPDQLYQKKNGSLISNLKGEGKNWGKQADITSVDTSGAQMDLAVSNIFAAASIATSMYYMKSIDDKLKDIQESVKTILHFLETDKQSQVKADLGILQEIAEHLPEIKSNPDIKQMKLNQLSALQREAKKNIQFYKMQVESLIRKYTSNKTNIQKRKSLTDELQKKYFYYRVCLQENAFSKLVEIQLTESFSPEYLATVREEVEFDEAAHKGVVTRLLEDIYGCHMDRPSSKALLRASSAFEFLGHAAEKTPLSRTSLDEKLYGAGLASEHIINRRLKNASNQILGRDYLELLDPIVDNIKAVEEMASNEVRLIVDNGDAYLEFEK